MPTTPAAPRSPESRTGHAGPAIAGMGPARRRGGRAPVARMRPALTLLAFALGALPAAPAAAQSPPSFQQYPLDQRIFGPGGAIFPDYSNPSEYGITYYTSTAPTGRGAIFAAGTADFNCQQTQVPQITVLAAPPGGKVSIAYGSFLATGIDGGAATRCLGQDLKGLVVRYKGRAAPGATVTLRVFYPVLGPRYDHIVPVRIR